MKKLALVNPGEVIEHTGDLSIAGDVGEGAVVNIKDGALTIGGNVGAGSRIQLSVSEESRSSANSTISIGSMTLGGSSVMSLGGSVTIYSGGKFRKADMLIGNNTYIGNVNIDNRIFTNGKLIERGNNRFEIFQNPLRSSSSLVKATIDGKDYAGIKIIVNGKQVDVHGLDTSFSSTASTADEYTPHEPKISVSGTIFSGVTIISDAPIEAKNIEKDCDIRSEHEGITAENIGDNTSIHVRKSIKVSNIGSHCQLTSSNYGITAAGNIGNHTKIEVRDSISVAHIGSYCQLTSRQYGITAGNIGDYSKVKVRDAINVANIGNHCSISSEQYGITARNVGIETTIKVRDEVSLENIGSGTKVTSKNYGLQAKDLAANVTISARDDILLRNVGSCCNITSRHYGVKVQGNIGDHSAISARNDIRINGTCPQPETLRLTSRSGEVSRPRRARSVVSTLPVRRSYVTGSFESDLHAAIRSSTQHTATETYSRSETVVSEVTDPASATAVTQTQSEIPDFFKCPILLEIMQDPVLCCLDGRTYERSAITHWLSINRSSPLTRVAMQVGQAIDDVLFINRDLVDAIQKFKSQEVINNDEDFFECPIQFEIMQDPMLCSLDGRTYERIAITNWLSEHGDSPITRNAMLSGQKIDDVLFFNRDLSDAIEKFKQQNSSSTEAGTGLSM